MEGHSICPLPEKKQSVSHIEKRCVEELKQQCFDHELQHGYLVLKHVEGTSSRLKCECSTRTGIQEPYCIYCASTSEYEGNDYVLLTAARAIPS